MKISNVDTIIITESAIVDLNSVEAFKISMGVLTENYIITAYFKTGNSLVIFEAETLAEAQDALADIVELFNNIAKNKGVIV
jgi:hypothetical protein